MVRRPGSTLSSVIRNAYDCTPLETAAKVEPVRCAQPYITLSAAITPAELFGMLFDARDTTASAENGLGNRPLYLYAVREKLVANPKPTAGADRMAEEIAKNIHSVYGALQPTKAFLGTAIPFTPEAAAVYEQEIYPELNAITGHSLNASKLFGRLTTNARKIAGILAVIAGEPAVSVGAIKAAAGSITKLTVNDVVVPAVTVTVTPVPLTFTVVAPATTFVPVSVTATVVPAVP